jgi:hypothetical protein
VSWDAYAFRVPAEFASVACIPADFEQQIIGDRAGVIEQIMQAIPDVDASDPSWLMIDGDDCSIEISLSAEQVQGLSFFCRGNGEIAIGILSAIARTLALRIVDLQSGDFLEPGPQAEASFARWRAYRDQVIGDKA